MSKIPRFSPSFSLLELGAGLKALVRGREAETIRAFEEAFARYIGVNHAVMLSSARMGTYYVLKGWGLGPGDEVLVPGFTYFSIPSIMIALGVKPVFVDIDPDTYLMDPEDLARKITVRSKAVIPTHLYGFPCPMDEILEIAWGAGLKVLEDCAQATGARYHGKRLGSFGDATYYTFGLTKNITTLRGGMITTDDDALATFSRQQVASHTPMPLEPLVKELAIGTAMMAATDPRLYPLTLHPAIRLARTLTGRDVLHSMFEEKEVLYNEVPAWFSSAGTRGVQGAVGLVQLTRIDRLNGMRASHGQYLLEHLSHAPGVRVPKFVEGAEPIYMSFPIQVANREPVARAMLRRGVDSTYGYMRDCSSMSIFEDRAAGACPRAGEVERQILHIPVHPNLTKAALQDLVETVRRAVLGGGA